MPSTHHAILIHVVFGTKLRKRVLADRWRDELFAYIGGTVREHKAVLLSAGGIEDHVHLLVKVHPAYAIADTVKLLKANSSRWINAQRKISARFEWQRGYGVFSVSQSIVNRLKSYIANQREHHRKQTFREEYAALLRRHVIEFDPKRIFDDEFYG